MEDCNDFLQVSANCIGLLVQWGKQNLILFKGVLHLLPQISMFCALSQNNQHLLEK